MEALLNLGADADTTFGGSQSSLLGWALHQRNISAVRLLLYHGACLEHISDLGWSLLFCLWHDELHVKESCIDLMQILHTTDPITLRQSHQGLVDIAGYSILDRLVCMGHSDEIEFLIRDGADVYSTVGINWNVLFNATYDGRFDNLLVLVPHFPYFVQCCDFRGWTLLHVAGQEGHDDIGRFLLQNGADWQAKSWACDSIEYIDEQLRGMACTPAEAARVEGYDREKRFMRIVEDVLGSDVFTKEDGSVKYIS